VRDSAFEQQLHERLELAEQDKRNAVELATTKVASELQKSAAAKDAEIQGLKARSMLARSRASWPWPRP
jgi:pyridoxal/pyridoxine/pyridoxamine kinase